MQGRDFILQIKEKIYTQAFQALHRIGKKSFTRDRKLPFPVIFSMILKLVKKSLGIECELMEWLESQIAPSKQAFSKARYKIRHTGFIELLEDSLKASYTKNPSYGTWKGYRVIAADGSSLRLPNSPEIIATFGLFKPNGTDGKMPPLGRVSLFVDLCTSMICSARLAAWNVGEQTLAEEQLTEVVTQMRALKQEKLLFIYDRGYPSLKFMHQHRQLNADFLFRVQEKAYLNVWRRVSAGEFDFDSVIETQQGWQEVRVIAVALGNGKREILVTSLFDREHFTREELSKIYCLRWHIEECYKRLKISAEIENFSGIHLEAVLQEFWAHLVMCNILSLHMCDVQGPWNPERIPEYRLNFSILLGVMREKLRLVLIGRCEPDHFQMLFDRAATRAKIKVRPGRSYSREKVGKPKRRHVFRRVC
jgi:Transposase DDE domain